VEREESGGIGWKMFIRLGIGWKILSHDDAVKTLRRYDDVPVKDASLVADRAI